jgi:hypothetical protein
MDDAFLDAINKTVDASFDASAPTIRADTSFNATDTRTFGANRIAERRSGSSRVGFLRPGERKNCMLDGDDNPYPIETEPLPKYFRMRCTPSDEDKRGAWQLQEEYLAGRLGKNAEENSRNWNTIKWIDKHYRVVRTPAEALPPLNIYVGDKISQSTEGTGAPTGPDDESPDEVGNKGFEFESINVGDAEQLPEGSIKVMDEAGTTHRLDIKADDYALLRLIDAFEEIDDSAKIGVNDLMREGPPVLPQADFPSDDQRVESGKIIRMLMVGMRTLWSPVIRAIASHADMKSLSQGKGKDVAAAVGRQRVIEGLRLAESIRKGLGRHDRDFSMWQSQIRARQTIVHRPGFSVDDIIKGTLAVLPDKSLPKPVRATEGHYLNLAAGPVIKLADKPLAANDNCRIDAVVQMAA